MNKLGIILVTTSLMIGNTQLRCASPELLLKAQHALRVAAAHRVVSGILAAGATYLAAQFTAGVINGKANIRYSFAAITATKMAATDRKIPTAQEVKDVVVVDKKKKIIASVISSAVTLALAWITYSSFKEAHTTLNLANQLV